jgi:hypothetical protein
VEEDDNAAEQHQQSAQTKKPAKLIEEEIVDAGSRFQEAFDIYQTVDQRGKQQHKGRPKYLMPETAKEPRDIIAFLFDAIGVC